MTSSDRGALPGVGSAAPLTAARRQVSWGMRIAVLDAASVMEAARSVALGDVLA